MPDANGYPYPWEPGYRVGQGTANPATPAPNASNITTGQPVSTVQVPAATNIDPQASAPRTTTTLATSNTAGAAGATGAGGANATTASNAPGTNLPRADPIAGIGNPAVDQITAPTRQAMADANTQVTQIWTDLSKTQQEYQSALDASDYAKLQTITPVLNSQYARLVSAQNAVATANSNFATAVDGALKSTTVDPAQADALRAQATNSLASADEAKARAQVLTDGAESQRALAAAQGAQASNQALLNKATADSINAKTPQDIATAQAQQGLYQAQADQISKLLPGLVAKQQADTTLTQHQVSLTDAESDYNQALAKSATSDAAMKDAQTKLLVPAQAGLTTAQAQLLTPAQAVEAQSNAALNYAKIQQAQQGPLYGIADQIKQAQAIQAVAQQVWGPGGSGNAQDANDLLQQANQAIAASLGGTTPYAASVAAQNAAQNVFGTQAAMFNQGAAAAASRANALMGTGGNVLATLASLNANAPKGSTAMAGAFGDVMRYLTQQAGQGVYAPPTQPTTPQLPPFLQRFAAPSGAGAPQTAVAPVTGAAPVAAPPTGATGPVAAAATPQPLIGAQPSGTSGAQTSAPVTINIGGTGGQSATAPSTTPAPTLPMPGQSWTPPGANYSYPGPAPWAGATPQPLALPAMAAGGVVNRPTVALLGEAGPEAVVPLGQSPAGTTQPAMGRQTSAPVTINIGGQGTPSAMPGAGAGGQNIPLPGVLQQYAPPTVDFLHQLWDKELQSGAVQSPYQQQRMAA